jgi:putative membrane protein
VSEPPAGPPTEAPDEAAGSEPTGTASETSVPETPWRRLDARMLLVNPLETLIRALPAVIAIVLARATSESDDRWELLAVPVILAFGALRWLTTRYRIDHGQIELRRGVLTKQTTTARLDKVRAVDLTAKVYHRLLGLTKVEISTGSSAKERIVLDSLRLADGRRLRAELLHRIDSRVLDLPAPTGPAVGAPAVGGPAVGDPATTATAPPAPDAGDEVLVRLDPRWVRYAPLTLTGLASAAAVVGFALQALRTVGDESRTIVSGARRVRELAIWVDVVAALAVVSLLAVVAYVLTFWGFRLTRNRLGSFHTRRGLLTSRETSIDHGRVRGLRLDEPLGLRLAGGRRLKVVTTGLGDERGGSDWLCPPAPRDVVTPLARRISDDEDAVEAPVVPHGPAARRRRLTRALVAVPVVAAGVWAVVSLLDSTPWLWLAVPVVALAAVALGVDRYAGLGHLVTPRHLVTRWGSLDRRRVLLRRDGVIGWTVRRSFFQRRAGVATLVATTAAGSQHYDVVDLELERAYALLREVDRSLADEFA